jgi:hypothetical protein
MGTIDDMLLAWTVDLEAVMTVPTYLNGPPVLAQA